MRTIKFKGKRVDTGEWVIGSLLITDDNRNDPFRSTPPQKHFQIVTYYAGDWNVGGWEAVDVNPETIGQFTGLYDKDGKEIYEGDVILQQGYYGRRPMLVRFYHGAFVTGEHNGSSTTTRPMLIQKRCEVLGNIHDNPELLKGGEE